MMRDESRTHYFIAVWDAQGNTLGTASSRDIELIKRFGEMLPASYQRTISISPPEPQEGFAIGWKEFLDYYEREKAAKTK